MKLSIEQIEKVACGVVKIEERNGCFKFNRFTDEQLNLYEKHREGWFFDRARCSSGVRLVFNTDSKQLKIKGITRGGTSRSFFAIDVFVNNEFLDCFSNFSQTSNCVYVDTTFPLGEFEKTFKLGTGIKKVEIFLPFSVRIDFDEISLDDGAFIEPIKRSYKGLIYGDSITQGYDCLNPSNHYAVALSKALDTDFVNKAIGGEFFNPKLAEVKDEFEPKYVVVAYGTNDWGNLSFETFAKNCKDFYFTLSKNYPNSKIFALAPIWRKEIITEKKEFDFELVGRTISDIVKPLNNVTFIDCFDFVNHEEKYFADLRLHPNDLGFGVYGENLCKKVKERLNLR